MASNIAHVAGPVRVLQSLTSTGMSSDIKVSPIGQAWSADKRRWSLTVSVDYAGTWTAVVAEADKEWLSASRLYSTKLNINVEENETGAERTGTITIAGSDGSEVELQVKQSAVDPLKFALSPETITIPAEGGRVPFQLASAKSKRWRTNCLVNWAWVVGLVKEAEAAGEIDEWMYKTNGMGNATLAVVATANTTGRERKATLVFRQGIKKAKLVVTQPAVTEEPEESTEG